MIEAPWTWAGFRTWHCVGWPFVLESDEVPMNLQENGRAVSLSLFTLQFCCTRDRIFVPPGAYAYCTFECVACGRVLQVKDGETFADYHFATNYYSPLIPMTDLRPQILRGVEETGLVDVLMSELVTDVILDGAQDSVWQLIEDSRGWLK